LQIDMKRIPIIFLILIVSFSVTSAADSDSVKKKDKKQPRLNLTIGYRTVDVSKLRDINEQILTQLPFPAEITDDYPFFPSFQLEANLSLGKKLDFGLFYSYHTTGSRIHYQDYSGEYKLDNILNLHQFGAMLKLLSYDNPREGFPVKLEVYLEAGLNTTEFKSSESITLGEGETHQLDFVEEFETSNQSFYLEPGARLLYFFGKFNAGLTAGFSVETSANNICNNDGFVAGILIGFQF